FTVEVPLDNGRNEYAANMIAKLKINDKTIKDALVVPSNIIQKSVDGTYILAAENVKGAKTATKKMVTPGLDYNGETVIDSGLNEGDKVITFGYSEVVDGQQIDY
ncbi:MAG TPA: hypothetical protein VG603_13060, partial [Chitinophagales bacterium]|nr:hypothetical protein [Chitinophagales bacterium]